MLFPINYTTTVIHMEWLIFFLAADKSYITVIMASLDAFRLMKNKKWDAVKEMLSKGQLSKADLEVQHGVR